MPGEHIFPGSLERTLEAFAAQAGSACPVVDDTLRIAAVIEGLSCYAVTTGASLPDMSRELTRLVWAGFFLNTSVVFVGFIRGLEGALLLACRTATSSGRAASIETTPTASSTMRATDTFRQ